MTQFSLAGILRTHTHKQQKLRVISILIIIIIVLIRLNRRQGNLIAKPDIKGDLPALGIIT